MRSAIGMMALALAVAGCGGSTETTDPIPLGQVPVVVVKAAQKRLPDVAFDAASKRKAGKVTSYGLHGKDKAGKPHEVKVSTDGSILGVE